MRYDGGVIGGSMNSNSYILVVLGIVLAKIVGFSRDIFFANFYGTSVSSDIYFQIFGIVTLVFTGIGVALSTRVIMNLNKEENSGDEREKLYVSRFLQKSLFYLLLATAALYAGARVLARILLPNATGEEFELAVRMTYIMLPSFIFVAIAYIISGVLQNKRVFFIPSIVSLPYNAIIIASLFIKGVTIEQIGIVTTIGWFLHIVIQLPDFYKKGYRFFYHPKAVVKLNKTKADMSIWWIFLSNMMFQLCFIIDKAFVSGDDGMVSILNYASNLFVTISSVFVVAMSSVVFPSISKNYEEGKKEYVGGLVGYIFTVMFAVFVPFLLVVCLFGGQIISLVYERGEFTHESTVATAAAFALYSLGILGYLAQELLNKIFYLASKYAFTVVGTVLVVAAKIVVDAALVPVYGTTFAAASTAVLLTLYAVTSFVLLHRVVGNCFTKDVLINIAKVFVSGVAAVLVYLLFRLLAPALVDHKLLFIVPIAVCGIVYVVAAFVLRLHKALIRKPGN